MYIPALQTKERIKEVAGSLFLQYGPRSVSMDDIAAAMGSSKKTLYYYFTDKDELVHAVVEDIIKKNAVECKKHINASQNAIQEAFLGIDMIVEMFSSMNPSLVFELQKYHKKAYDIFLKHKSEFLYGVIKDVIYRGIDQGLFRDDIDVEVATRYRVESINIPFTPEFYSNVKVPLAKVQEHLMIFFLYSIATLKGFKLIERYKKMRNKKSKP